MNDEQQTTGGRNRKYPPATGSFEEWLEDQVDREALAGAVARFVLEDRERGCWVDAFDHDYYMMRHEKMRRGVVKHVILKHHWYGKPCVVLEMLHRKFEVESNRRSEQVFKHMDETDAWIL